MRRIQNRPLAHAVGPAGGRGSRRIGSGTSSEILTMDSRTKTRQENLSHGEERTREWRMEISRDIFRFQPQTRSSDQRTH